MITESELLLQELWETFDGNPEWSRKKIIEHIESLLKMLQGPDK